MSRIAAAHGVDYVMAQAAYFRVSHNSFNRGDWGYGRVAAAARYAANENKKGQVATVGLPIFRTSYDAERAFMALEKQATRKNARLGDSLIIAFPNQVKPEHRQLMMERFLWRVTFEGKTYAQAWEHTDKTHNPHFHVVLVDRDRLTGKSVGKFGHSRSYRAKQGLEPNVTEWFRQQWEATGNEMFGELGYDLSFDRRSNLARGLEPAGEHRGPEPADHFVDPTEKVETPATPEIEDADTGDADMDATYTNELVGVDPAGTIQFLHSQKVDLEYLKRCQTRLQDAEERHAWLLGERDRLSAEAGMFMEESHPKLLRAAAIEARLADHQTARGTLKGRELKVFGYSLFKTGARKAAENASLEADQARMERNGIEHTRRSYDMKVEQLAQQAIQAERAALAYRNQLETTYGAEEDMKTAERLISESIAEAAYLVTLEQAQTAFADGSITLEEYRAYLLEAGHEAELQLLDDGQTEGGYSL